MQKFQERYPNSILQAKVGFMNPTEAGPRKKRAPKYKEVCSGTTGHLEVLHVTLANPSLIPELIQFFFMFHDPTTRNRQRNDVGTQYASAIFVMDDSQYQIALGVKQELQLLVDQRKVKSYERAYVETQIWRYTHFYPAHSAHQQYLTKNPFGYCNHYFRFRHWPRVQKGDDKSNPRISPTTKKRSFTQSFFLKLSKSVKQTLGRD